MILSIVLLLPFRYIRRVKQRFIQSGHPVVRADTRQKELWGTWEEKC